MTGGIAAVGGIAKGVNMEAVKAWSEASYPPCDMGYSCKYPTLNYR